MEKFPDDIKMAEVLTDGDPNILLSNKFSPQKKPDISGLFGGKKIVKKKRLDEDIDKKNIPIAKKAMVTHPRFLRESDHEIRIRQQPVRKESTSKNIPRNGLYPCHLCEFTASRVNVLICHLKNHRLSNKVKVFQKVKTKSNSFSSKTKSNSRENLSLTEKPSKKLISKQEKDSKKDEKSMKNKSDAELKETLLADWNEDSDENEPMDSERPLKDICADDSPIINNEFKMKKFDESFEHTKANKDIKATEFLLESNKILEETDSIVKFSELDVERLNSTDDLKFPQNKFGSFDIRKTEKNVKKTFNFNDDNEARLSCYNFNEDDIPESSVSPSKKIPRSLRNKNIPLKKEIIKEFKMIQALKNDVVNLIGNDMEEKNSINNDQIFLQKQGSPHMSEFVNYSFEDDEITSNLIKDKEHFYEVSCDTAKNSKTNDSDVLKSDLTFNFAINLEGEKKKDEYNIINKIQKKEKVSEVDVNTFVAKNKIDRIQVQELFETNNKNNPTELSVSNTSSQMMVKNKKNEFSLDILTVPFSADQSYMSARSPIGNENFTNDSSHDERPSTFLDADLNLYRNSRKRRGQSEDNQNNIENSSSLPDDYIKTDDKKTKNQTDEDLLDSKCCKTNKKQKFNKECEIGSNKQSLDFQAANEPVGCTEQLAKIIDTSVKVDIYNKSEDFSNESIVPTVEKTVINDINKTEYVDCEVENSLKQSKFIF